MSDVSGFLTGFSDGLNKYMQLDQQNKRTQQNEVFQNQLAEQSKIKEQAANQQAELEKSKGIEKNKQDLAGKITPEMAEGLIPGSSKWVQGFQQQNGRLPTVDEAKDGMQSALLKLTAGDDKEQKRQDMLEKQYHDKLTSVRGDASLTRLEHQKDAAAMAYDTVAKSLAEKRPLSELEQTDVIAQLYQARVGKAPTDQDMKELNQKTAKRGFNHMVTYLTGDPTVVGASTEATLANLKQFIESSGSKADEQWQSYMAPRMNPPTGLDKSRTEHVASQHRGLLFSEQKQVSDTTYKSSPKKSDPLGIL